MIAELGFGILVIAFAMAVYSAAAAIYGGLRNQPAWAESARYGMLLTWPLITLAALSLISLLLTGHY